MSEEKLFAVSPCFCAGNKIPTRVLLPPESETRFSLPKRQLPDEALWLGGGITDVAVIRDNKMETFGKRATTQGNNETM